MPDNRPRCEIVAQLTKEGLRVWQIAQALSMTTTAVRDQRSEARKRGLLGPENYERAQPGFRKCRGTCQRRLPDSAYHAADDLCPNCREESNLRRARAAMLRGLHLERPPVAVDPWPLWRALGLPEVAPVPAAADVRIVRLDERVAA